MPANFSPTLLEQLSPINGVSLGIAKAGVKKPNRKDLLLITLDEDAKIDGVFTQNRFCAAPVIVAKEHLFGIDELVEAVLAAFDRVHHNVPFVGEQIVAEAPVDDVLQPAGLEPVFPDHGIPERALVGHALGEADGIHWASVHVEIVGDLGPSILPAEHVAVRDVEGLVGARRLGRHPYSRQHRLLVLPQAFVGRAFRPSRPFPGIVRLTGRELADQNWP